MLNSSEIHPTRSDNKMLDISTRDEIDCPGGCCSGDRMLLVCIVDRHHASLGWVMF